MAIGKYRELPSVWLVVSKLAFFYLTHQRLCIFLLDVSLLSGQLEAALDTCPMIQLEWGVTCPAPKKNKSNMRAKCLENPTTNKRGSAQSHLSRLRTAAPNAIANGYGCFLPRREHIHQGLACCPPNNRPSPLVKSVRKGSCPTPK